MPMDRRAAFFAFGGYLGATFGTKLGDGAAECFDVGRDDMTAQADCCCRVPALSAASAVTAT